jgi:hypothetical protein
MIAEIEVQIGGFIFPVELDLPHEIPRLLRAAGIVNRSLGWHLRRPNVSADDAARMVAEDMARALIGIRRSLTHKPQKQSPRVYASKAISRMRNKSPQPSEFKLTVSAATGIAYEYLSLWNRSRS